VENIAVPSPTLREMEDHLEHSGVKGMRWGVRRESGGGQTNSTRKSDPKMDELKAKVAKEYVAKHSKVTLEEAMVKVNSPTKFQTFMNTRTGRVAADVFDTVWWYSVMTRVSEL
jgi:hypothetical protein